MDSYELERMYRCKNFLKGGLVMKWQGYNGCTARRLNRFFGKLIRNKGVYYLLTIVAFGLLLGASMKWHP